MNSFMYTNNSKQNKKLSEMALGILKRSLKSELNITKSGSHDKELLNSLSNNYKKNLTEYYKKLNVKPTLKNPNSLFGNNKTKGRPGKSNPYNHTKKLPNNVWSSSQRPPRPTPSQKPQRPPRPTQSQKPLKQNQITTPQRPEIPPRPKQRTSKQRTSNQRTPNHRTQTPGKTQKSNIPPKVPPRPTPRQTKKNLSPIIEE
jgi:hypothetical protein